MDTSFIAVLGPPAAGKSTLTASLADRIGASVFRLREFAHRHRHRTSTLRVTHWLGPVDWLGWFGDDVVLHLLHAALVGGAFGNEHGSVVVLENLPGNERQLLCLGSVVALLGAPLGLIELSAPDELVRARSRSRRVCPTCEPDPLGDPHRPALAVPDRPDLCIRCGGAIVARRSDASERFEAKLTRFRATIGDIRRAATELDLPYRTVDVAAPIADVLAAGQAAARSLLGTPRVKETV